MFKDRFTRIWIVGALLIALVVLFRMFDFQHGVTRSTSQPGTREKIRQSSGFRDNKEPAGSGRITFDKITPSDPDEEVAPEIVIDNSTNVIVEPDFSELQTIDTPGLCRRLGEMIRSGESPETIAICEELIKRGDDSVGEVGKLLSSGSKPVETAAMRILVRMGTARSIGAAIPKMIVEPDGDSRKNLLKVFGNVRNISIAGVIADMMANEQKEDGRSVCKEILTAMEGGEVVEALSQRISAGKEQAVIEAWLDVLASMSKPSNVAALEGLLISDDREAVQAAVARSLAAVGDSKACLILAVHAEINPACRSALAGVTSPYAQRTLMEIASGSMGEVAKAAAIKALSRYNTAEARNFLGAIAEKDGNVVQ